MGSQDSVLEPPFAPKCDSRVHPKDVSSHFAGTDRQNAAENFLRRLLLFASINSREGCGLDLETLPKENVFSAAFGTGSLKIVFASECESMLRFLLTADKWHDTVIESMFNVLQRSTPIIQQCMANGTKKYSVSRESLETLTQASAALSVIGGATNALRAGTRVSIRDERQQDGAQTGWVASFARAPHLRRSSWSIAYQRAFENRNCKPCRSSEVPLVQLRRT